MIKRFLVADDVSTLFTSAPMPLGWLIEAEDEPIEQSNADVNLDSALNRGFLEPIDLVNFSRPTQPQSGSNASKLAKEWSVTTQNDPDFFGDSVLNNTSLVLYVEAYIGGRRHRILLPGDQENWTYLFARNPRGIQVDILKASHHGGRVYIESELAHDELFSAVQPQAVLFSANGRHNLPRNIVRQSAMRWGATVFCTSRRKMEFVTDKVSEEKCCHKINECTESRNITLILDQSGIRSESPACHSGFGRQLGPVINVQQHIVEPSRVISNLFENELRQHINWIKSKLKSIHENRVKSAQGLVAGSTPISEADLITLARAEKRALIVPHIREILEQGMRRDEFWAARTEDYYRSGWHAYALPKDEEIKEFLRMLGEKVVIIFPQKLGEVVRDRDSVVNNLEIHGLCEYADATLRMPSVMFRDAIWPHVAYSFKSRYWHCYTHTSGRIGFSRYSERLSQRLLESFMPRGYLEETVVQVDESLFPFQAPILVGGKRNPRDFFSTRANENEQAEYARIWMGIQYRNSVVSIVLSFLEKNVTKIW